MILPSGQNATATGGANSALLGAILRDDGSAQVTYNGYPLYYYSGDQATGDTKGQGLSSFGANWYLIIPIGIALQPESGTVSPGGGGYPVYPVYPVYPRRPRGGGHSPRPTYTPRHTGTPR